MTLYTDTTTSTDWFLGIRNNWGYSMLTISLLQFWIIALLHIRIMNYITLAIHILHYIALRYRLYHVHIALNIITSACNMPCTYSTKIYMFSRVHTKCFLSEAFT